VIAILALGGVVGADRTAFGQTMLADPLFAALLAGTLAGDAVAGLAVGIPLALVALAAPPIGNPRPLDWSSAAVVGGALAGATPTPPVIGAVLLIAAVWAWVGGGAVLLARRVAHRGLGDPAAVLETEGLAGVRRRHLAMLALHALRGILVVGLGLWVGSAALRVVAVAPAAETRALTLLAATAPLVALPGLVRLVAGGVPRRWLVVGCALAFVGLALGRWT